MLYEFNGNVLTEDDVIKAQKISKAVESGEIKPINNIDFRIAEAIMKGKCSQAVTLFMAAKNVSRIEARKFLEENGENLCSNYLMSHNIMTVGTI